MCRLLGYCARQHVSVAGLLGEDGLRDFTALSAMHRDGWGMAWYDARGPHSRKSPLQAADEPGYQALALSSLGDMGLVHLRWATPGLAVSDCNSHPFRHGPYTFAHNGAIHPQDRLGEILPPAWEQQLGGTTDSERYFLHIMSRLPERRGDVIAAIGDTVAHIDRLLRPNSLNAVLLAPDALYAICWYHPDRLPIAQLRSSDHPHSEEDIAAYFDLSYRRTGEAVVVASSGWPRPGWAGLPNRHVLVVDRATLQMSVHPIGTAGAPAGPAGQPALPAAIDTTRPHQARIYDYWLGGSNNFAVDREAAERALAAYPGLRRGVRAQRAFLANAVGYLTRTAGIRQFLDIGTGIPAAGNTHEVAHAADPGARVVYVDNDPMVLAHARALLTGSTPGTTSYLDADLRDTATILARAAALLDFRKPIGVLLIGILQLIPDADDPGAIVTRLLDAVPPGSWLAIFHPASDILADQVGEAARQVSARAAAPTTLRTKAEITRFFDGLEFLEPGLVQVHRWRPGSPAPDPAGEVPGYAGLARKP